MSMCLQFDRATSVSPDSVQPSSPFGGAVLLSSMFVQLQLDYKGGPLLQLVHQGGPLLIRQLEILSLVVYILWSIIWWLLSIGGLLVRYLYVLVVPTVSTCFPKCYI